MGSKVGTDSSSWFERGVTFGRVLLCKVCKTSGKRLVQCVPPWAQCLPPFPSLLPSSFSPTANIFAEKSVNPLPPKPFERIFDRPQTAVILAGSTFLSINGYKSQVQLKYRPPMCRVSGHLFSANQDGVSIQWRSRQRVLLQIRGLIYRVSKRGAAD